MSPFADRGAADFARALESGTAGTLPGLALAARLRAAGASLDDAVAPRPEFRDALRMRLVAVATVQAAAPAAAERTPLVSAVSWRRRLGAVAAGSMASVVAVTGVAVAGSQSLPGDPFYGVKRTVESLQLSTADGEVERGTRHLELAATRLREVRGLSLGRDAVTTGPELGPAALDGFALRSASRPVDAPVLSAPLAERVRDTLAAMDEQTREGSALLTEAYRSSRATEPLRVLDRFATRQAQGLEQLLPALPPRTQDRARISLALLTDVSETAGELLSIGTCGTACDPSTAAPTLPAAPGTAPAPAQEPCDCSTASPEPLPAPSPTPSEPRPAPQDSQEPQPEPTRTAEPEPSSPAPSPSPSSSSLPVPLPSLPVPVPSLPVPVPTLTLAPLAPAVAVPGTVGKSSTQDARPAPTPTPTPLPLAPLQS